MGSALPARLRVPAGGPVSAQFPPPRGVPVASSMRPPDPLRVRARKQQKLEDTGRCVWYPGNLSGEDPAKNDSVLRSESATGRTSASVCSCSCGGNGVVGFVALSERLPSAEVACGCHTLEFRLPHFNMKPPFDIGNPSIYSGRDHCFGVDWFAIGSE